MTSGLRCTVLGGTQEIVRFNCGEALQEVIAVYLRPEARGQGGAVRLLDALAAAARAEGLLQLELEVADWNAPAITAYKRAGFRRTGVMPRAMRDGARFTDDLVMVLPLDGDGA